MTTNHANTRGAKKLPPVFGTIVDVFAFLSLDLGLAFPSSGCLVARFEDQLVIETLGFITVLACFALAYFNAKARQYDDANIHLRRSVDVSWDGAVKDP